ncbi:MULTISPECIES: pitrilysin family protein [unclassified Sulfurospirillum]|uniref:M16 family metallopeptidase n=1 Tax=unclassified Sulfurospirillum TaxID=2618290 RepID=UPI0025E75782|nr:MULTISPECIES: pitrilysin family protein [unclassified Sulfurospirillum]
MANSLPEHFTKTLENGLQIVVIPMHNKSDVITTDIFYKVGSGNEIMGKSGIAHMLEHLNFKSTKNLKTGEFDEIVKGFGGVNNASTGFDFTHYYIKSSSKNLPKSLELFAELMQNLKLSDEEFQPERNVVLEERLWRTDNSPIGYLYFRLFNNAFTYHPYHWTPIGFKDDIKNWSIEDIRSFHAKYYQPSNAIVVVAGDIEPETVFSNVSKYFGEVKNTTPIPPKHHQVEPQQDGAKRLLIKKKSEVEMVAIAYKIPNFAHKDQVALSALSELLSSGKSSKLHRILVDEKKLVNQIYGYAMEAKDPSVFLFLAVCNPDVKAESVETEILKIIESLKKGDVSDRDIEKIKINTKADFIHNLESSSELATLFGSYYAKGDISPLLTYEESINTLKKEDIIKAVNTYLVPQSSTTVILRKDY